MHLLATQNVLELADSPSSTELFWNIGEFKAKKYFTDHPKANGIQLFVATKGNFFWSDLFLNK